MDETQYGIMKKRINHLIKKNRIDGILHLEKIDQGVDKSWMPQNYSTTEGKYSETNVCRCVAGKFFTISEIFATCLLLI